MESVTKSSKKWVSVAGGSLFLIILAIIGNSSQKAKNTVPLDSQGRSTVNNQLKSFKTGDTIQSSGLQISFSSVIKKETYIDSGGDSYKASQGAVWLIAFVQYKNTSDHPINLPIFDRIVLYDPNGYKYTESLIGVGYPFPNGTNECSLSLFPAITCNNYYLFEVSQKTLTKLGWYFTVNTGSEYVIIDLDTSKL